MDVRYLKVLLLFMTECHTLSAVIATTCQPQGDAYKIIAYKKRTQQSDISECTLYTTNTDQDEVKCGRKCKQPEYSCLFYTLQGNSSFPSEFLIFFGTILLSGERVLMGLPIVNSSHSFIQVSLITY